jgi:hypothetical protein
MGPDSEKGYWELRLCGTCAGGKHEAAIMTYTQSITMSQSASTSTSASRFESIFASALDAYTKRTRKDLSSHPLLTKLQSCDSADAIITLLREQIPAFSQSQSSEDRFSNCLIPTVNVLCAFSAALGEGVGLVNTTVSSSVPRL